MGILTYDEDGVASQRRNGTLTWVEDLVHRVISKTVVMEPLLLSDLSHLNLFSLKLSVVHGSVLFLFLLFLCLLLFDVFPHYTLLSDGTVVLQYCSTLIMESSNCLRLTKTHTVICLHLWPGLRENNSTLCRASGPTPGFNCLHHPPNILSSHQVITEGLAAEEWGWGVSGGGGGGLY